MSIGMAMATWGMAGLQTPVHAPTWAFVVLFYCAELIVVHFRFRRDAHSFSMSEVPLVLGLFLLAPSDLLIAQFCGSALALGLNRRQAPVKLAFNLTQLCLQGAGAAVLFHAALGKADPLGPLGLLAIVAAIGWTLAVSNILIGAAIRLSGGKADAAKRSGLTTMSVGAGLMNAALGLVGVTIAWARPSSAWIAAIPPLILQFAYRAYVSQRQERERLEVLYEASRELHALPEIGDAIAAAAERARLMFDVDSAEALLYVDGPSEWGRRTVAREKGPATVMEPVGPLEPDSWIRAVMAVGHSVLLAEDGLPVHAGVKPSGGMLALIHGATEPIGFIRLAAPHGDIGQFTESDLRLLDTLGGQVGVSIENGRLEHSLARLNELKDRLHHQTLHDGLTGVGNRLLLHQMLAAVTEPARNTKAAILFLDLDDFKAVNDTYGHNTGDRLLVQVARRLVECCRPADTVARIGGDEFALILDELHASAGAEIVARRILTAFEVPFRLEHHLIEVGASIGVAMLSPGERPEEAMRAADEAMYAAKKAGKGIMRIHGSLDLPDDSLDPTPAGLRGALRRSELVLHYQPIVDLVSGEIVALEALVRWAHPERGLILPGRFIPMAERTGLIHEIGARVVSLADEILVAHRTALGGPPPVISLNLSAPELANSETVGRVLGLAERNGIDPSMLQVEITESAIMAGDMQALVELRSHGVRIAVDDFGTGYSSLSYLDRLPIDVIKLDRSFVSRVDEPRVAVLMKMMVEAAHALGCTAVAEGIETPAQLSGAAALGCGFGQGFLLGHPLGVEETIEMLSARARMALPAAG
jgi:diguanylate cyclase (GGDEF)-like protein